MKITLYSNGCPKCDILKSKLSSKHIEYTEINDEEYMKSLGLDEMPVLETDGNRMEFSKANEWVNKQ